MRCEITKITGGGGGGGGGEGALVKRRSCEEIFSYLDLSTRLVTNLIAAVSY